MPELLRGKGAELGAYGTRFPIEQRTMLHVLDAQARERPDATWIVVDGARAADVRRGPGRGAPGRQCAARGPRRAVQRRPVPAQPDRVHAVLLRRAGGRRRRRAAERRLARAAAAARDRARRRARDHRPRRPARRAAGARRARRGRADRRHRAGGRRCPSPCTARAWSSTARGSPAAPTSARASCPTAPRSALIQFTSGTTGNSKGVVYPHHFLYLYSAAVSDAQGHTTDDVLTTPLPLFHVAALHIICNSALHAGCTAHLKSRFSARSYWQEIADDGATFGIILGTLAAILLRHRRRGARRTGCARCSACRSRPAARSSSSASA